MEGGVVAVRRLRVWIGEARGLPDKRNILLKLNDTPPQVYVKFKACGQRARTRPGNTIPTSTTTTSSSNSTNNSSTVIAWDAVFDFKVVDEAGAMGEEGEEEGEEDKDGGDKDEGEGEGAVLRVEVWEKGLTRSFQGMHATWLPLQPRRFRTQLQAAITHYTSYSPSSTLAANISGEILIGAAYVTPAPEPAAAAISPAPSGALTPLTPILSALSGLTGGTVAGSLLSAASSVSASGATMRTKEDHWELRIEGLELRNLLLDRSASLLDAARLKLQPSASIYTDVHVGDKSVRTHEVRVRRRRDAKAVVRYPGAIVFEVGGLRRSVAPRRVGFVLRIRGPFQSRLTDTTLGEAYAEIASIPKVYPEDENDKDDKSKSVERQWFKFSPDCGEVGARLTLHAIDPPNPLTTSSTISSALDHKEGDDARANFISRVLRGPDAAGVLAPDESKPVVAALDLQVVAAKVDEGEGGGGEPDTYCVVQYEHRWEKTAVIVNSREAVFDDCFRFEVREPSSLLTVTLWDDCSGRRVRGRGREDAFLGMVRMRLSTLDANRRYDRKFQLLVPDTSGGNNNNNNNSSSNSNNNSIPVRRVGWLRLVFCLAVPSRAALLRAYIRPAMPAEAYIEDATDAERARRHKILTKELVKALKENEPALQIRPEVVKRVRDNHYDFDLRIAKINYNRTSALIVYYLTAVG
eukprot:jgi/Chlat1/5737/Chrsp38S05570